MLEFLDDNFLSELVLEPTSEISIFLFYLVNQGHLINNIIVGEHLGSCGHKALRSEISTTTNLYENKTLVQTLGEATSNISEMHYHIYHWQQQTK